MISSRGPRGASLAACALFVGLAGCGSPASEKVDTSGEALSPELFTNDRAAFDYFLGKGLTAVQAAGIVGNLDQESGVNPSAVQGGGPGRGIAQWSVGGRWDTDANDNATWYAQKEGQSVGSLSLQLDFIWYELTTFSGYGLASLRGASTVTDATVAFETDFEGCGTCDQSQRIAYANAVYAAYKGDSADGGSSGPDGGTACFVTTLGESGECMLVSDCAKLPGHVSTPGYCPGAADIQCCTGPVDAGTEPDADDGATGPAPDAGSHARDDAGHTAPQEDAGAPPEVDASAPEREGGPASGANPDLGPSGSSCAAAPGPVASRDAWWGLALAAVALRRRRAQSAAAPASGDASHPARG